MKTEEKKLISVIVPVYNVEKYLDECVASIVNQTYKKLEIILVDDGSSDNSPIICDKWAKKDSRIKVIHKKNGGQSEARNVGLDNATGDYIGFIDSDDYIDSTMYEKLLYSFCREKNIGITSCQLYTNRNGKIGILSEKWEISEPFILKGEDYAANKIQELSLHSACNKLYRAELFTNLRFRIGLKNEDTLFMYDLGKVMKKSGLNELIIPDHLIYYRIRENSTCTSLNSFFPMQVFANLALLAKESKTDGSGLHSLITEMTKREALRTGRAAMEARERAEKYSTTAQLLDLLYYQELAIRECSPQEVNRLQTSNLKLEKKLQKARKQRRILIYTTIALIVLLFVSLLF